MRFYFCVDYRGYGEFRIEKDGNVASCIDKQKMRIDGSTAAQNIKVHYDIVVEKNYKDPINSFSSIFFQKERKKSKHHG